MAGRRKGPALLGLLLSVLLMVSACSSSSGGGGFPISIVADDGLLLQGRFHGQGVPGVILVHDFDSNQRAWSNFADVLVARGFLVLTYDMRGHSNSPGDKDISKTNADLSAAVRSMRTNLNRPLLFIIGEGLGGIAALNVASLEKVLGVVTISSPAAFRGLDALGAVSRTDSPKLFLAAENDAEGADSARVLLNRALDPKEIQLFGGEREGADLVNLNSGARDRIVQFLDENKP